jgi:tRNA-dihydrouridine synthase
MSAILKNAEQRGEVNVEKMSPCIARIAIPCYRYAMSVPCVLAPMAELSHRALRELIEGFGGADEYYSEMISAAGLLAGGPFERYYTDGGPRPEKMVYQLAGGDAGQLARAAALLDRAEVCGGDYGGSYRGIDINMGCSAPLIVKTGAGAAWLADIDKAGRMIAGVRPQVKRRLSVKLRIGFDDDFENLLRFCRRLQEEGVELITLHPRTAREKFRRRVRWAYITALKNELSIPVAGNGDINSVAELCARSQDGTSDTVMIGRLAVREPWAFAAARKAVVSDTITVSEDTTTVSDTVKPDLRETALTFLGLLEKYQPPEFHLSRARRFFHYYCGNFKWAEYLRNLINRETSLRGIAACISTYSE